MPEARLCNTWKEYNGFFCPAQKIIRRQIVGNSTRPHLMDTISHEVRIFTPSPTPLELFEILSPHYPIHVLSSSAPMTLMMRPRVSGPTGILMGELVSTTCWPRTRPSVPSMAIVRTVFSPGTQNTPVGYRENVTVMRCREMTQNRMEHKQT